MRSLRQRDGIRIGILGVAAAVLLLLPAGASAQRVTVTSSADGVVGDCTPEPGGCTLREAMVSTPDGTIVDLPAGTYDLTDGPLPPPVADAHSSGRAHAPRRSQPTTAAGS